MATIKAQDIEFTWRDGIRIGPLTFEANHSEIIGVFGRSGTGKTTLFRILVGELMPENGILKTSPKCKRVYHDQLQKLVPWLSATKNALLGLTDQEIEERSSDIQHLFEVCGLSKFAGREATRLSGGQRARVTLIRSLLESSDVLLLDEPFVGMDARTQDDILVNLPNILSSRLTFITAHDPGVLVQLCDKIICLRMAKDNVAGIMHNFQNAEFISLDPQQRRHCDSYVFEVQSLVKALYDE